jgi:hypothetical protein
MRNTIPTHNECKCEQFVLYLIHRRAGRSVTDGWLNATPGARRQRKPCKPLLHRYLPAAVATLCGVLSAFAAVIAADAVARRFIVCRTHPQVRAPDGRTMKNPR